MAESKENLDARNNNTVDKCDEKECTGTPSVFLNDFCCLKILELLPLAELYAMSQTSTRFEALSADVFCRRYPNKAIVIDYISDKGKINQGLQEKYAKFFSKYIPNVTLSFGKDPTRDLIQLCKMYDDIGCPIKSLQFKEWEAKVEESHGVAMRSIVERIESVTFTGMKVDDVYESMLKFMPNIKSLTFRQTYEKSKSADFGWMKKSYPKLEYFSWYESSFPVAQLKALFDGNPTIRHFSLLATLHETIEQLVDSPICIDELFIDFDRFNHVNCEYTDTLKCLLVICKRQPGIRLHMKCDEASRYYLCQHFDAWLPLTPYIEGLYFLSVEAIGGIPSTGSRLHEFIYDYCTNLKILQLNCDTSIDWAKLTPKLESVFFYYYSSYNRAVDDVVYHTHRLKNNILSDTGTRKLKIYTSSLSPNPMLNYKGSSIEIIRTESEIVNNPLVSVKERRGSKRKAPFSGFTELDKAMLRAIFS